MDAALYAEGQRLLSHQIAKQKARGVFKALPDKAGRDLLPEPAPGDALAIVANVERNHVSAVSGHELPSHVSLPPERIEPDTCQPQLAMRDDKAAPIPPHALKSG